MTGEEKLQAAFVESLGLEPGGVKWYELEYRSIPQWDSVAHMQLVAEIEDTYDIMLDIDDVIAMSSFEVTKEIIMKYGVDLS